jgi:hypothetical protein
MSSFEMGDARKENWVLSGVKEGHLWSHPLKYKSTYKDSIQTEYYMVLRLAEQYLIRAEARAQQNKLTGINGAAGDIDSIRLRAGLPGINTAATKDEMLNAIAKERRMELFVEWGHRWLDLKRTGKAKEVLSLVKTNWQDNDTIYPIPYKELQLNPRLKQNSGY